MKRISTLFVNTPNVGVRLLKKSFLYVVFVMLVTNILAQNTVAFDWAKSMGGNTTATDGGSSIFTDNLGNVYTIGNFWGTADFDPGPGIFNLTSGGKFDVFIQKLDVNGDFVWAKSFGGIENDQGVSITLDSSGNIYAIGRFLGTADFDPGVGTFNLTTNYNNTDPYILKLDVNGDFVWAKSFGGPLTDNGNCIITDASENVYVTGSFEGTDVDFDPGTGVFNLTSAGGGRDVYVLKLDVNGDFAWAKSFGGTGDDQGSSIALDTLGNIYIGGYFPGTATDFDPGAGVFNLTSIGDDDVFIQKLDANGDFIWAKSFGGTGDDRTFSIAVDPLGNVYSSGLFAGTAVDFDPGAGTYPLSSVGSWDIFVSKLDANGDFVWAKSFGGINYDQGNSIALDQYNNVYVTGYFSKTVDFDSGIGTFNMSAGNSPNVFVTKLDVNGSFLWAKSMGGSGSDLGTSITVDSLGNVYTTGRFERVTTDFDPGAGVFNLTSVGGTDAFVHKMRPCTIAYGVDVVSGVCNNYTWIDGNTYTSNNNTATHLLTSSTGCDSIVTLNLTLGYSNTGVDTIKACNNYTWIDGNIYTSDNNTATHTLTNASGCDSVVTLYLTLNNSVVTIIDTTIQQGDSISIGGNIYTQPGNYNDTLQTVNNCDSIVKINITDVTGVEEILPENFKVYPNPTKGNFSILFDNMQEQVEVKLMSVTGQLVTQKKHENTNEIKMEIHSFSGVYILYIYTSRGLTHSMKIIKQ